MSLITIDTEAYEKLLEKLNEIERKLEEEQEETPLSEKWMDNEDVCRTLYISKRTLQHYRDSGKIPYSKIGNKIYYKASDVEKLLTSHYNENNK